MIKSMQNECSVRPHRVQASGRASKLHKMPLEATETSVNTFGPQKLPPAWIFQFVCFATWSSCLVGPFLGGSAVETAFWAASAGCFERSAEFDALSRRSTNNQVER